MRWSPRRRENRFKYEIYAYGGINTSRWLYSFGEKPIPLPKRDSFPRGIRKEFIRSALEYNFRGSYVHYWMNGRFNASENVALISPCLEDLPNHIFPLDVEVYVWAEEAARQNYSSELRSVNSYEILHEDGQGEQILGSSLANAQPVRAAYAIPDPPGQVCFLADTQYVRVNAVNDMILFRGPHNIVKEWISLRANLRMFMPCYNT